MTLREDLAAVGSNLAGLRDLEFRHASKALELEPSVLVTGVIELAEVHLLTK